MGINKIGSIAWVLGGVLYVVYMVRELDKQTKAIKLFNKQLEQYNVDA